MFFFNIPVPLTSHEKSRITSLTLTWIKINFPCTMESQWRETSRDLPQKLHHNATKSTIKLLTVPLSSPRNWHIKLWMTLLWWNDVFIHFCGHKYSISNHFQRPGLSFQVRSSAQYQCQYATPTSVNKVSIFLEKNIPLLYSSRVILLSNRVSFKIY